MSDGNNDDLFENKMERVYAEVRRLDQLLEEHTDTAEKLNAERVKRLDERLDAQAVAVSAALAAAEKAVAAALAAADKSNDKAESAQKVVNATQNEFRGSLKDQALTLMPRAEAENTFRELRGLITQQSATIQDLRSRIDIGPQALHNLQTISDRGEGRYQAKQAINITAGTVAGGVGAVAAIIYLILRATGHG